jgi:hypothetical protein
MKRWMEKQHLVLWMVLIVHRDRFENWSLAQTWLQGPDYCPLLDTMKGCYWPAYWT